MTATGTQPRSSRKSPLTAPPGQPIVPLPSRHARRRLIGWMFIFALLLLALPVVVTATIFSRSTAAYQRVLGLAAGAEADQEQLESALLDDWAEVETAVCAVAEDPEMPPNVRWRCLEMIRMHSPNEALAERETRQRQVRLAFNFGDFLEQERAEDRFLNDWPAWETAVQTLARDRDLPDCVRLRCVEMVQFQSDQMAAVALAHFSRATRCYRAAGVSNNPAAASDAEAAWIYDDRSQYQTPDARFALGTPPREAWLRARDGFSLAQALYYDLADQTSGNQKLSAEERAERANRLYLACIKFTPLDVYEQYMQERKKAIEENRRNKDSAPPAPEPAESN